MLLAAAFLMTSFFERTDILCLILSLDRSFSPMIEPTIAFSLAFEGTKSDSYFKAGGRVSAFGSKLKSRVSFTSLVIWQLLLMHLAADRSEDCHRYSWKAVASKDILRNRKSQVTCRKYLAETSHLFPTH